MIVLRLACLPAELIFWMVWITQFSQQRWAASFHDNKLSQTMLQSQNPPIWFTLPSHIPFWFIAFLLFIWGTLLPQKEAFGAIVVILSIEPVVRAALEAVLRLYHRKVDNFYETLRISPASLIVFVIGMVFAVFGIFERSSWKQMVASAILLSFVGLVLYASAQNRADNEDGTYSLWRGRLIQELMS